MSSPIISPTDSPAKFIKSSGKFVQLPEVTQLEILKTVLEHGNYMQMAVFGMSMHPFLQDGDIVLIKPLGRELPEIGDVVAFQRPENGQLVIHRIIAKMDGFFEIKGDNVTISDGRIPHSQLIGKITLVTRGVRHVDAGLGKVKGCIARRSKQNQIVLFNRMIGFFPRTWKYIMRKLHINGY